MIARQPLFSWLRRHFTRLASLHTRLLPLGLQSAWGKKTKECSLTFTRTSRYILTPFAFSLLGYHAVAKWTRLRGNRQSSFAFTQNLDALELNKVAATLRYWCWKALHKVCVYFLLICARLWQTQLWGPTKVWGVWTLRVSNEIKHWF